MSNNMDNPPPYNEAIKQPAIKPEDLMRGTYVHEGPAIGEPSRIVIVPAYGPDPQMLTCPSCHARIRTRVEHKPNTSTHLMAVLLLILFWPCALYPYCTDSCQDAHHYCPNCGTFLGAYQQN